LLPCQLFDCHLDYGCLLDHCLSEFIIPAFGWYFSINLLRIVIFFWR